MNCPFRLLLALLIVSGPLVARGDEVTRQVQEELRRRNLYFGDVDGRFTAQIAAALRRYQQRKGFAPSGQADETTLRSLSLLPPAPAVASAAAAVQPTPGVYGPPVPWPDLPVLRSDQGRRNFLPVIAEAEITDPTPMPPPKPPPAAVSARWPGDAAVRSFVTDYLRQGESNQPGAQRDFYADKVDYFNSGVVSAQYIARDTDRYNKRWPERRFTLLDPVELATPPDGGAERFAVNFHYQFRVRQPGAAAKTVTGETKNTYVLERTGPDSMRIVSIKEERVREK